MVKHRLLGKKQIYHLESQISWTRGMMQINETDMVAQIEGFKFLQDTLYTQDLMTSAWHPFAEYAPSYETSQLRKLSRGFAQRSLFFWNLQDGSNTETLGFGCWLLAANCGLGRGMLRIFLEEEATRNLSAPAWIGGAEVDWERCLACSRYKNWLYLVTRGVEKHGSTVSIGEGIANLAEWPQNSMIAIYP